MTQSAKQILVEQFTRIEAWAATEYAAAKPLVTSLITALRTAPDTREGLAAVLKGHPNALALLDNADLKSLNEKFGLGISVATDWSQIGKPFKQGVGVATDFVKSGFGGVQNFWEKNIAGMSDENKGVALAVGGVLTLLNLGTVKKCFSLGGAFKLIAFASIAGNLYGATTDDKAKSASVAPNAVPAPAGAGAAPAAGGR